MRVVHLYAKGLGLAALQVGGAVWERMYVLHVGAAVECSENLGGLYEVQWQ